MKPHNEGEMEGRRRSNVNRIDTGSRRSAGARTPHNQFDIDRYPSWRHKQTQATTTQQRNVSNNITRTRAASTTAPDADAFSCRGANQRVVVPQETAGDTNFRQDDDTYATLTPSQEQARWNDMVFPDARSSAMSVSTSSPAASATASRLGSYNKEKHDNVEEAKAEEQAICYGMVHPDTAVSSTTVTDTSSGNLTSKEKKKKMNGQNRGGEQAEKTKQNDSTDIATAAGADTTTSPPPAARTAGAFAVRGDETVQRGGEADTFSLVSDVRTTIAEENSASEPRQNDENGPPVVVQAHLVEQPAEEMLDSQARRIQQLEAMLQQQQQLQQPTAPLVHAEIASFVAPMESHDNNDDEAPSPPLPVEEPTPTIMEPEEKMVDEKCFAARLNHLMCLGVILLLIGIAVAVAIPLAIDSNSSPNDNSPYSQAKSPSTLAPNPAPSPDSTPVGHLPDGPWKQLGQELRGKAEDDYFGWSVSLSRDAQVLAVGASQSSGPGYVSVFEMDNSKVSWMAKGQELIGEANGDWFGRSVVLNGDGTVLAVGAPYNDGGGDDAGNVRVFQHDTSTNRWVQLGSDIEGEAIGDWLGYSVSLSKAGNILAVGSTRSDSGSVLDVGSVQMFQYERDNDSWEPLGQTLLGEAKYDEFGYSVSLSSSGEIVAVGAKYNDFGGTVAGQVSMYQYNSASSQWDLMGSPINGQVVDGEFGRSVSLDNSGLVVVVGAPGGWSVDGFEDERVVVYSYDTSTSMWIQRGETLKSQEPGIGFGESVSLSGNGNVLAVGSRHHDNIGFESSGQVAIFQYNTNTMDWDAVGESLNGQAAFDNFGESVSLSEDGTVLAVGADGRDFNGLNRAGSASVYTLN